MSDWTVDTLKEHYDSTFTEHDLRYEQRFQAGEKRLDGMNEFRQALSDSNKTYITRIEAQTSIDRNSEDIKLLTARMDRMSGQGQGVKDSWGWLAGLIGLCIAAFALFRH